MRILLTTIFAVCLLSAKSQTSSSAPIKMTVKCHPSLGFVTNVAGTGRSIDFTFEKPEEATLFFVENVTHQNFVKLVRQNDSKSIARAKLVLPGYEAKPHDLVYSYSPTGALQYYYIVNDYDEETAVNKLAQ